MCECVCVHAELSDPAGAMVRSNTAACMPLCGVAFFPPSLFLAVRVQSGSGLLVCGVQRQRLIDLQLSWALRPGAHVCGPPCSPSPCGTHGDQVTLGGGGDNYVSAMLCTCELHTTHGEVAGSNRRTGWMIRTRSSLLLVLCDTRST